MHINTQQMPAEQQHLVQIPACENYTKRLRLFLSVHGGKKILKELHKNILKILLPSQERKDNLLTRQIILEK